MATTKSQNSNMLLAFLTLLGVIAIVAVVGFFMLRKGPEIIQGQAEVTEYRVSSKVPGRILEFRVKEGQPLPQLGSMPPPGWTSTCSKAGIAATGNVLVTVIIQSKRIPKKITGAL